MRSREDDGTEGVYVSRMRKEKSKSRQMMHPIRGESSSMGVIVSSIDIYPIHG